MCLFLSDPAQFQFETTVPYDTILSQSHYYKMSLIFVSLLSIGFFCLILCIRFVFGIFARFKPKKSHARRSRTVIVRPFAFPFPSLHLSCFFIHLSRLHAQFAAIHTHICICIFIYKQALRQRSR